MYVTGRYVAHVIIITLSSLVKWVLYLKQQNLSFRSIWSHVLFIREQ